MTEKKFFQAKELDYLIKGVYDLNKLFKEETFIKIIGLNKEVDIPYEIQRQLKKFLTKLQKEYRNQFEKL